MNELLNNCDFWKEDARMAYRLPLLVICADITNWSRHVSHHVQTWLQSSQPSTSGRTTTWLELSCEVKPFAIVDVDHKEKLSFSSLFAGFLFVTLWKCLRINSLGFVFLVASLNGSVLFMPLWKVGHFRNSTGEFERIAEVRLYLMFWAFYSTPDMDGRQLLEQMENCIFQEREKMDCTTWESSPLGGEGFLWWQRNIKGPRECSGRRTWFLPSCILSKGCQRTTQNRISDRKEYLGYSFQTWDVKWFH